MRVLNFSIGRVQPVQIGSEVVRTAHIKQPVTEPWRITEDGAEGDERAVHPDKLYAFSREAYDYWGDRLSVEPSKWPDGFFGENITVDKLDETGLRVGDVFRVGREVKLVVSGARTPCVKLAWRLGQPRSFQKTFALSRRSGVYLDVLTPGRIKPGDQFERIDHDPAMPSIADICDMIDSHKAPPLEALMRLLDCQYLSPANRLLLGAKVELAKRAAESAENRWRGWRYFSIAAIKKEAERIKSFDLKPLDATPLCLARPGQFISVRLGLETGEKVERTWSLSSFSENPTHYRITVLRQDGPGSRRLHSMKTGDTVALRAPTGNFVFDMGSFRPPVFIAAGVGITPIMAMLEAQLTKQNPGDSYLIYAAKEPGRMAFREDIDALRKKFPGLRVKYIFSQSPAPADYHGRITINVIKDALKELNVVLDGKRIELPWFEADFYLCGPEKFCEEVSSALAAGGANQSHIYSERFTVSPQIDSELPEARVVFTRSGKEARWTHDENLSILELAEENGVEIESDCRAGACLTCKTKLQSGATTADLPDGDALLCIARPNAPLVEIDA